MGSAYAGSPRRWESGPTTIHFHFEGGVGSVFSAVAQQSLAGVHPAVQAEGGARRRVAAIPDGRSATLSSAKTARRFDTWLVLSGALAAALAPISGPFVATELFWSRLPAAVRPCGSAAELIGRRVKLFGLGRIGITRWPRE